MWKCKIIFTFKPWKQEVTQDESVKHGCSYSGEVTVCERVDVCVFVLLFPLQKKEGKKATNGLNNEDPTSTYNWFPLPLTASSSWLH